MAGPYEPGAPLPPPHSGQEEGEQKPDKLILERELNYWYYVRLDLILKVVGLSLALAAIGIGFFVYRDRLFLLAGSAVSAIFLLLDRAARRLRQVALRELGELARLASKDF